MQRKIHCKTITSYIISQQFTIKISLSNVYTTWVSCDVITHISKWPIFGDFVDENCEFHSFEIRTAIFNNNSDV